MNTATAASSKTDIQNWLVSRFAELSQIDPRQIDVDRPFADYQLDSAVAVTVSHELGERLERELSITLFWDYPTIRDLSEALGRS
ncbi:MAG TPA: acyl carrier protein [Burkholderiaceae bacterium]|jgi:acyl carrier protein